MRISWLDVCLYCINQYTTVSLHTGDNKGCHTMDTLQYLLWSSSVAPAEKTD